ncbi:heme exporter protein CcmD [Sphingomonas piscis]
MNQWAFVIAAYAVAGLGVGGLIAWAWSLMRRAERRIKR